MHTRLIAHDSHVVRRERRGIVVVVCRRLEDNTRNARWLFSLLPSPSSPLASAPPSQSYTSSPSQQPPRPPPCPYHPRTPLQLFSLHFHVRSRKRSRPRRACRPLPCNTGRHSDSLTVRLGWLFGRAHGSSCWSGRSSTRHWRPGLLGAWGCRGTTGDECPGWGEWEWREWSRCEEVYA
jgi:hypothetical protein